MAWNNALHKFLRIRRPTASPGLWAGLVNLCSHYSLYLISSWTFLVIILQWPFWQTAPQSNLSVGKFLIKSNLYVPFSNIRLLLAYKTPWCNLELIFLFFYHFIVQNSQFSPSSCYCLQPYKPQSSTLSFSLCPFFLSTSVKSNKGFILKKYLSQNISPIFQGFNLQLNIACSCKNILTFSMLWKSYSTKKSTL